MIQSCRLSILLNGIEISPDKILIGISFYSDHKYYIDPSILVSFTLVKDIISISHSLSGPNTSMTSFISDDGITNKANKLYFIGKKKIIKVIAI